MKPKKPYHTAKKKTGQSPAEAPRAATTPLKGTSRGVPHAGTAALVIATLAVALYVNTLGHDFTLDDRLMITENQFTKDGVKGIGDIFTNDAFTGFYGKQKKLVAGGRYRPLSQVVFAIEYQLFGMKPFPGHLVNVALYALTCVFLFYLLKKLLVKSGKPPWYLSLAFVAAILFAAHPLHTEVVANIKGLDEILCFLGSLCTLYFVIKYAETGKALHLLWSFVSFLLALLSKESAVTFLAVIPLVLFFTYKVSLRQHIRCFLPLLAATAVYILMRFEALGFLMNRKEITEVLNNPYINASAGDKAATIFYTWGRYLLLLVFPHPLTHDYYPKQIPILNWGDLRVLLSFAIFLAMAGIAALKIRRRSIPAFAILFFIITFSISSNLFFNVGTFMNERFMFVPSLGFTLILGFLLSSRAPLLFRNPATYRRTGTALLILVLALYSLKTVTRNMVWKNDFTLFTTDVKVSSNSTKCNVSAGGMYYEKARKETDSLAKARLLDKAQQCLTRGVNLYPGNSAGWVLLGNVMLEEKKYDLAREYYENCLHIYAGQSEALSKMNYLGQLAAKEENYPVAARCFRTLVAMEPNKKDHYYYLADAIANLGQPDSAVAILQKLITDDPGYEMAYAKLGEIYGKILHDLDQSLVYLNKAISLNPKDLSANENLGIVYGIRKDFRMSLQYLQKALAIDSTVPRIYLNIGSTYNLMGDKESAKKYTEKAARLRARAK